MSFRSPRILPALTVATLTAGFALVFFFAPNDADQGFIQKIFYLHVPLATCALVGFIVAGGAGDPPPAHRQPEVGCARLRLDPHLGDLRRRRADHRSDLGEGLVGQVVGLGRADPGQLPDRLPPLLHLLPAALRDRGPRAPGPLRVGVRDHGRRLRAAQLHRRAARPDAGPPAGVRDQRRRPAAEDVAHVPRLPRRDGAAVGDAGPLRARGEVVAGTDRSPAPGAGGRRAAGPASRIAPGPARGGSS